MKPINAISHPEVKRIVKLRTSRSARRESNQLLLIGKKPVRELCTKENTLAIWASSPELVPKGLPGIMTTYSVLQKITGMQSPEGVAAVVHAPPSADFLQISRLLILDGVSDPGNVGTLFRTAFAFGWEGVFLLPKSADPYNDKALRAGMGSQLLLPWREGSKEELLALLQREGITLVAALPLGEENEGKNEERLGLLLGSESHGVSPDLLVGAKSVGLKMNPECDSLNVAVAGGILLYLLMAKETKT